MTRAHGLAHRQLEAPDLVQSSLPRSPCTSAAESVTSRADSFLKAQEGVSQISWEDSSLWGGLFPLPHWGLGRSDGLSLLKPQSPHCTASQRRLCLHATTPKVQRPLAPEDC